MGILIYVMFFLLTGGLGVLCFFMIKKEIKDRKAEKEAAKENKEEQVEEQVKEAIKRKL